ncbi:MAG: AmmeMemoRadiSam system protein A [Desulfovibrionaceae bacterium]|jgi:AmmeMemoRadiSam system protein A|nr:AmmeMemoRadiSam system protein A [Desulfovibrionaceae bacterium]
MTQGNRTQGDRTGDAGAGANQAFRLQLSDEEKNYCKDLVRLSIQRGLERRAEGRSPRGGADAGLPEPPSAFLKQPLGAFVTLKIADALRGCIGNVIAENPLHQTIAAMARAAAFEDPRFPPLSAGEYERLSIEISILGPLTECPNPALVEVGRHGLLISHRGRSGLLLPQVPLEWGWDRETFLRHTCQKAGLPADDWKDPDARLFWFEAEVF